MLTTNWVDMYPSLPSHNGKAHLLYSKAKADVDFPASKGACDPLPFSGLDYESTPIPSADGELGCLLETPIAAETDAGTANMFMREDEMEAWLMDSLREMNGQDGDMLPQAWQSTELAVASESDAGKSIANAAVGSATQSCVVVKSVQRHQQGFVDCETQRSTHKSADKLAELPHHYGIPGEQCPERHPATPAVHPALNDPADSALTTDSCVSQSKARSQAIMRLKEHLMKLEQEQKEDEPEQTKQQQTKQRTQIDSPSHQRVLPLPSQSQSQPPDHLCAWQVVGAARGSSPPSAAILMHTSNGESTSNGVKIASSPAIRPSAEPTSSAPSGNKSATKSHPLNFSHFSRPAAMFARGRAACGLSSAARTAGSSPDNHLAAAATAAPADAQQRNVASKQMLRSTRPVTTVACSPSSSPPLCSSAVPLVMAAGGTGASVRSHLLDRDVSNNRGRGGNSSVSGGSHPTLPSSSRTIQLQGASFSLHTRTLPSPLPLPLVRRPLPPAYSQAVTPTTGAATAASAAAGGRCHGQQHWQGPLSFPCAFPQPSCGCPSQQCGGRSCPS